MFDFASAHRNEGDALGVNSKGLVTFGRKTRKDAFYFYKANWSAEPVTYITSRRYTDRAYAVTDVKVYSNADSIRLTVNGKPVGTMTARDASQNTFVFKDVRLARGQDTVVAVGDHHGKSVTDSVQWTLNTDGVAIAAGWIRTGYVSSRGVRFGSDCFFLGGIGEKVPPEVTEGEVGPENLTANPVGVHGTKDPLLYRHFRRGAFAYDVPLENGSYEVTLGFLEPDAKVKPGNRVFDVSANGNKVLERFDVLAAANGARRTAVTRVFTAEVTDGHLKLDFTPVNGQALVSAITIRRP